LRSLDGSSTAETGLLTIYQLYLFRSKCGLSLIFLWLVEIIVDGQISNIEMIEKH
jgi:hypothetical protein